MAVLLRTLTEKSKMKFGKTPDFPVWKHLETFGGRCYLAWVYYNCSMVSFTDEILEKLYVVNKIAKPGKDEDLYRVYETRAKQALFNKHGYKSMWKKKSVIKGKEVLTTLKGSRTKSNLQAMNHGRH